MPVWALDETTVVACGLSASAALPEACTCCCPLQVQQSFVSIGDPWNSTSLPNDVDDMYDVVQYMRQYTQVSCARTGRGLQVRQGRYNVSGGGYAGRGRRQA